MDAGIVQLLSTVVTTGGLIFVALIANGARRSAKATRAGVEAVREQVENDHSTNMRDESDTRHRDNTARLGRIEEALSHLVGDVRGLRGTVQRNSGRIYTLEKQNRKEHP